MSQGDFFEPQPGQPQKQGMSGGMKVLIILLCIFGGFALICCGTIGYIVISFGRGLDETPQAAVDATKEIADIQIPERFQPRAAFGGDMIFAKIQAAVYEPAQAEGVLMLMQFHFRVGETEQLRQQMRGSMQGQNLGEKELEIKDSEMRQFMINGVRCTFTFAQAEDPDTNRKYRQVSGSFPGKGGPAVLMLQIEEQAYDEDEIVKMIESIK